MKLVGHRGAKDEWPENTLLGMRKAINNGVFGLEIDIHLSKDNKIMVIHDKSVDRTTNASGDISRFNANELREFDAGMGERIPYLSEVIDLVIEKNVHLFIEVKDIRVSNFLIRLLEEKSAFSYCTIISFNHRFIKTISDTEKRAKLGCIMFAAPVNPVAVVKDAGASLLVMYTDTIDKDIINSCHLANIEVASWCANNKKEYNRLKSFEADYIMTDCPSLFAL